MIEFTLGLAAFLLILVALGICADSWDARELRRDARQRNHVRRLR